jgi:hypothetical protein
MMKNYMSEQKENRASIGARSRRKWKKDGGRWKVEGGRWKDERWRSRKKGQCIRINTVHPLKVKNQVW